MRPNWKATLGLAGRKAPELIESVAQVQSLPFAQEIERVMSDFPISGIFCVQKVPQIIFMEMEKYDVAKIRDVHKALWNQGLARILMVLSPENVRVFSTTRSVKQEDDEAFSKRVLIESIDALAKATEFERIIFGVESGRIWHLKDANSNYRVDPDERIDRVLLSNLSVAHKQLSKEVLTSDEAQAALIQTMFIAFLEDRGIINNDYLKDATKGLHHSLNDVLKSGNVDAFDDLFSKLKGDFNGDLFVTPCSFTEANASINLNPEILQILGHFRNGVIEMESGQHRFEFCKYNFQYIPISLISEVYDSFLNENSESQASKGAYYTPAFLADYVVTSVLNKLDDKTRNKGIFFDPACGSGVFLVRCFQRLCQEMKSKPHEISWESIKSVVLRMRGCDVDPVAVRVAVFSLYLAMLEVQCSRGDNRLLIGKFKLPKMWDKFLVCVDYFDYELDGGKADVIIGNPPWTSEVESIKTGEGWCKTHDFPIPDRQLAWAFTWKAKCELNKNGIIAFLVPARNFLHNLQTSVDARKRLVNEAFVSRVVNFSDLRRLVFKNSEYPTALILIENLEQVEEDYWIEYWVPKADLNATNKQFITLNSIDKKAVSKSEVLNYPSAFTQNFWMTEPELKLFSYISRFPRISEFVGHRHSKTRVGSGIIKDWHISGGFKSSGKQISNYVGVLPHLPTEKLSPLAISKSELTDFGTSFVNHKGFERAFQEPCILVSHGIKSGSNRLKAAFKLDPMTFKSSIYAICFPKKQTRHAKLLTAVLNSKLAIWYLFHSDSSLAWRKFICLSKLLNLPLPVANNSSTNGTAGNRDIEGELIDIVDKQLKNVVRLDKNQNETQSRENSSDDILNKIDELTYKFFGLSDTEIVLIEDTVDHVLSAVQPTRNQVSENWGGFNKTVRKNYVGQLIESLSFWLRGDDKHIRAELVAHNDDLGIIQLEICSTQSNLPYKEKQNGSLAPTFQKISQISENFSNENFQTKPDMQVFAGRYIYLIKPMQLRYWLRSTAIEDAVRIAFDINEIALRKSMRLDHGN